MRSRSELGPDRSGEAGPGEVRDLDDVPGVGSLDVLVVTGVEAHVAPAVEPDDVARLQLGDTYSREPLLAVGVARDYHPGADAVAIGSEPGAVERVRPRRTPDVRFAQLRHGDTHHFGMRRPGWTCCGNRIGVIAGISPGGSRGFFGRARHGRPDLFLCGREFSLRLAQL